MIVTVAICTWNRCESLDRTLARLAEQRIPEGTDLEVLVVNNNSTDATNEAIRASADRLPVRCVFEGTPGLSHARNAAVRNATGEVILWIDDDVLVRPGWLEAYRQAFREHADAAVFGGPIVPKFDGTPPSWLPEILPHVANAYAARALSEQPIPFDVAAGLIPFGANYAVRTAVQRAFAYDATLGRRPDNVDGLGEETAVITEILRGGHTGWWVPAATVEHCIPESRQTLRYLRRYFGNLGRIDARRPIDPADIVFRGHPRWLWRQAVEAEVRYRWKRLIGPPSGWIDDFIVASRLWGRLRERPSDLRGDG